MKTLITNRSAWLPTSSACLLLSGCSEAELTVYAWMFTILLWAFIISIPVAVILALYSAFSKKGQQAHKKQMRIKAEQDSKILCPHCRTVGHVTTQQIKLKKGISGGKATAAVLTAGVSILATGLSRKETVTEAKCSNCGSVWHF